MECQPVEYYRREEEDGEYDTVEPPRQLVFVPPVQRVADDTADECHQDHGKSTHCKSIHDHRSNSGVQVVIEQVHVADGREDGAAYHRSANTDFPGADGKRQQGDDVCGDKPHQYGQYDSAALPLEYDLDNQPGKSRATRIVEAEVSSIIGHFFRERQALDSETFEFDEIPHHAAITLGDQPQLIRGKRSLDNDIHKMAVEGVIEQVPAVAHRHRQEPRRVLAPIGEGVRVHRALSPVAAVKHLQAFERPEFGICTDPPDVELGLEASVEEVHVVQAAEPDTNLDLVRIFAGGSGRGSGGLRRKRQEDE